MLNVFLAFPFPAGAQRKPPGKKLVSPQPSLAHPTITQFLPTWKRELEHDEDKTFLLHGLEFGFPLVDVETSTISNTRCSNHKSTQQFKSKVSKRLMEEIKEGNYIETDPNTVKLISPLAAIEKSDGDVRLIHDLSYPANKSLNDFASKEYCEYENIADAIDCLKPGMWMAKCDLKWAYRSVPIKPEHYPLTGLQWTFHGQGSPTTLFDTALPFGARKSPAHFNRVTKSIKRMMNRRNFNCIVYLDDFLLFEETLEKM